MDNGAAHRSGNARQWQKGETLDTHYSNKSANQGLQVGTWVFWYEHGVCNLLVLSLSLSVAGEVLGDLFEVSSIRREDYDFHKGKSEYEEILQSNNLPSSATPRGHQTPAAFLIMASGLDKVHTHPTPHRHTMLQLFSQPWIEHDLCLFPSISMVWTLAVLCHTPISTSLAPAAPSPVYPQELQSLPWLPTTSCPAPSNPTTPCPVLSNLVI